MEFVDDGVPDGVELISRVVVLQREVIATSVTLRVISVDSGESVEWLVDVAEIVDEEAESI